MAGLLDHVRFGTGLFPWIIGPGFFAIWLLILLLFKRRFLDLLS